MCVTTGKKNISMKTIHPSLGEKDNSLCVPDELAVLVADTLAQIQPGPLEPFVVLVALGPERGMRVGLEVVAVAVADDGLVLGRRLLVIHGGRGFLWDLRAWVQQAGEDADCQSQE